MKRVVVSWSTGKDSAWALLRLRQQPDVEVVGLLTTFNAAFERVAMHAVRRHLVEAQAAAAGSRLTSVALPWPCSNEQYEALMGAAIEQLRTEGVTHIAFGDLFLEDVRQYRERQLAGTGIEPLFPLWGPTAATAALAREMQEAGLRAVITCVNPREVPASLAGRDWDARLLEELPATADPCGERGEFHTFCRAGPMFDRPITVTVGDVIERDGFIFADLS
jgi:uncharacterized protein (TIGR00290 family)